MLCAIKADNTVTAMAVLAYQPGGLQNQFLILGDVAGKLYAFNTRGQIAMEHDAGKLMLSKTLHLLLFLLTYIRSTLTLYLALSTNMSIRQ